MNHFDDEVNLELDSKLDVAGKLARQVHSLLKADDGPSDF